VNPVPAAVSAFLGLLVVLAVLVVAVLAVNGQTVVTALLSAGRAAASGPRRRRQPVTSQERLP
jgi:hypothetical protein